MLQYQQVIQFYLMGSGSFSMLGALWMSWTDQMKSLRFEDKRSSKTITRLLTLSLSLSLTLTMFSPVGLVWAEKELLPIFAGVTSIDVKPSHGKVQLLKLDADLPFEYQLQPLNQNQIKVTLLKAKLSKRLISEDGVLNIAPQGWVESGALYATTDPANEEFVLTGPGLGEKQLVIEGATLVAKFKAPRPAVKLVREVPSLPPDLASSQESQLQLMRKNQQYVQAEKTPKQEPVEVAKLHENKPLVRLQQSPFDPGARIESAGIPDLPDQSNPLDQPKVMMAVESEPLASPVQSFQSAQTTQEAHLTKSVPKSKSARSKHAKPAEAIVLKPKALAPEPKPRIDTELQPPLGQPLHEESARLHTADSSGRVKRQAESSVNKAKKLSVPVVSKASHSSSSADRVKHRSSRKSPQEKPLVFIPPESALFASPASQPNQTALESPEANAFLAAEQGTVETEVSRSIRSDEIYRGPQYEAPPAYPYQPQARPSATVTSSNGAQSRPYSTAEAQQAEHGMPFTLVKPGESNMQLAQAPLKSLPSGQNSPDAHVYSALAVATSTTPTTAYQLMQQALADFKNNNTAAAKGKLDQALALNPNDPKLYAALGEIHVKNREYNKAKTAYVKAYQLRAHEYAVRLAEVATLSGDRAQAVLVLNQYLNGKMQDIKLAGKVHYMLGTLYEDMGETAKALPHLQQAANLVPKDADVQYNLALAYELSGNLALAKSHYSKAVQLNPKALDAQQGLSRVKQR